MVLYPVQHKLQSFRVKFIVFILSAIFSSVVNASEKPFAPESIPNAVTVSADEVVEMILSNPDITVVDSRKRSEYLKGHIEGAINILNTELMPESLELIMADKKMALVFYCNGIRCLRSADSVTKAAGWGYSNIFWFRGGWKEWMSNRLPVVTD